MTLYLENCAILMLPIDHIKNDFVIFVVLSHEKLDLSFFFMAGPKSSRACCTYLRPKLPRKIINHEFWRNIYVCLVAITSASPEVRVLQVNWSLEKKR